MEYEDGIVEPVFGAFYATSEGCKSCRHRKTKKLAII